MIEPIWRDKVVRVATGAQAAVPFSIHLGQAVIYTGKAFPDGSGNVDVCINDICADYLGHLSITALTTTMTSDTSELRQFTVYNDADGDNPVLKGTYDVFAAWDGFAEGIATNVTQSLNGPITGEKVVGMPIPVSQVVNGQLRHGLDSASTAYNKTVVVCEPKVLYYFNPFGGWDALVMKGGVKRMDTIERASYSRDYLNTSRQNRGAVNYRNEITTVYECHTGWLHGKEGENLYRLVGSCDVWLWDSVNGFIPVVVTDSQVDFLNYKNNDLSPVNVTVTVEASQKTERR